MRQRLTLLCCILLVSSSSSLQQQQLAVHYSVFGRRSRTTSLRRRHPTASASYYLPSSSAAATTPRLFLAHADNDDDGSILSSKDDSPVMGRRRIKTFVWNGLRYYLDGLGIGIICGVLSWLWNKTIMKIVASLLSSSTISTAWSMKSTLLSTIQLANISGVYFVGRAIAEQALSMMLGKMKQSSSSSPTTSSTQEQLERWSNLVGAGVAGVYYHSLQQQQHCVSSLLLLRRVVTFVVGRHVLDTYLEPWRQRQDDENDSLLPDEDDYGAVLDLAIENGVDIHDVDTGAPLSPEVIYQQLVTKLQNNNKP